MDLALVMINEVGTTVDAVYYNKLESDCKAVAHSGDERDGVREGYDEVITVDLFKVNYQISYLALLINSFNGLGFSKVETATIAIF